MAETTAPLSTITPEQAASEPAYQTGTKAKPTITNESVLAELENIYKQRKAEKEYFLNPLKQAAVGWWNPQGPGVGLPLADRMRREEEADLQKLQSDIATSKIGIGQLQNAMASTQVGGAPQTTAPRISLAGGAPQAGGTNIPPGYKPFDGNWYAPRDHAIIMGLLNRQDLAGAQKYAAGVVSEENKFFLNPSAYEQKERWNEDKGRKEYKMPIETRSEYLGGAPRAPMQPNAPIADTNTQAAISAGVPVLSGYRSNEKQAQLVNASQQPGYTGPPVAPVGRSLHQSDEAIDVPDYKALKPEQLKWLADNGYRRTLPDKSPNHFAKIPGTEVSLATQKATLADAQTPRRFSSKAEQDAFEKQQAEFLTKSSGKSGEKAGERQAFFESAAAEANQDLQTTNVMLNILDKNPAGIGYGYKNKALGATIEGVKLLTGKDIEPLARRSTLSKEDMDASIKFDALAERNNLKFRQAVYKGTGQVSDFETKLSERASGLSRDNSVEANRFFATVAAENFRTLDKLGTQWQDYQKRNPGATFDKFEQSTEFKSAQREREQRLSRYFPELSTGETAFGGSKPSAGASSQEVEGWKQRYGRKPQ
jgi:hypothetical protein